MSSHGLTTPPPPILAALGVENLALADIALDEAVAGPRPSCGSLRGLRPAKLALPGGGPGSAGPCSAARTDAPSARPWPLPSRAFPPRRGSGHGPGPVASQLCRQSRATGKLRQRESTRTSWSLRATRDSGMRVLQANVLNALLTDQWIHRPRAGSRGLMFLGGSLLGTIAVRASWRLERGLPGGRTGAVEARPWPWWPSVRAGSCPWGADLPPSRPPGLWPACSGRGGSKN